MQEGKAKANAIVFDSVKDVQNVEDPAAGQHACALELEKKLAQALHQVKLMEEANAQWKEEKVTARVPTSCISAVPRERPPLYSVPRSCFRPVLGIGTCTSRAKVIGQGVPYHHMTCVQACTCVVQCNYQDLPDKLRRLLCYPFMDQIALESLEV